MLVVRGVIAVEPRTGLQRLYQLLLRCLPSRSAGRRGRQEPRVRAARESLRSGNLAVNCGPKGSALQGFSKDVCCKGPLVIDSPSFGQGQIPGGLDSPPLGGRKGSNSVRNGLSLGWGFRIPRGPGSSTRQGCLPIRTDTITLRRREGQPRAARRRGRRLTGQGRGRRGRMHRGGSPKGSFQRGTSTKLVRLISC